MTVVKESARMTYEEYITNDPVWRTAARGGKLKEAAKAGIRAQSGQSESSWFNRPSYSAISEAK